MAEIERIQRLHSMKKIRCHFDRVVGFIDEFAYRIAYRIAGAEARVSGRAATHPGL